MNLGHNVIDNVSSHFLEISLSLLKFVNNCYCCALLITESWKLPKHDKYCHHNHFGELRNDYINVILDTCMYNCSLKFDIAIRMYMNSRLTIEHEFKVPT